MFSRNTGRETWAVSLDLEDNYHRIHERERRLLSEVDKVLDKWGVRASPLVLFVPRDSWVIMCHLSAGKFEEEVRLAGEWSEASIREQLRDLNQLIKENAEFLG